MTRTRLIIAGFGQIGRMLCRVAQKRRDLEITGVLDADPQLSGTDAGTAAGIAPLGIPVVDDPRLLPNDADAAIVTTVSRADECAAFIATLLEARPLPVVTTCEELFYPWPLHADAAKIIDRAAREAAKPVLSVGVNPGFLMDYLPVVLSGATTGVAGVEIERIQDAAPRRPAFQKKIGAGLTLAGFEAARDAGSLRHVGLPESIHFIAAGLGWQLDEVTEAIEPVIAAADLALPGAVPVAAGCVRGVRQIGLGKVKGVSVIRLHFVAAIAEPDPRDRIRILGTPEIDSTIRGGVNGDLATAGIALNAARAVATFDRTGFLTMLNMPVFPGSVLTLHD